MLKNISYKLTTVLVLSQVCFADASRPWQMDFQDPATPIMEGIINFHNHIMFFITVIVVLFGCRHGLWLFSTWNTTGTSGPNTGTERAHGSDHPGQRIGRNHKKQRDRRSKACQGRRRHLRWTYRHYRQGARQQSRPALFQRHCHHFGRRFQAQLKKVHPSRVQGVQHKDIRIEGRAQQLQDEPWFGSRRGHCRGQANEQKLLHFRRLLRHFLRFFEFTTTFQTQ